MPQALEVELARVATRLDGHLTACERRYQEGNERMERMFNYIKDAHEKTGSQIAAIQSTIDQQKGAGAMGKFIGHAVTGLVSIGAAVGAFKAMR